MGRDVDHLWVSDEDGSEIWTEGHIVKCGVENGDQSVLTIEYDEQIEDENGVECKRGYELPLIEDYKLGDSRIT